MKDLLLELNNSGVKLHVEGGDLRVSAPKGALTDALKQTLRQNKSAIIELLTASAVGLDDMLPQAEHDAANADTPFPLTDLQQAYWLGRTGAMELGNVSTHVYMEFDSPQLDMARMNQALNRLIERHGTLRMVVRGDGTQQILKDVPAYKMATKDCSAVSPEEAEAAMQATRDELAHQILNPNLWPLFDFRATVQPNSRVRLHLSFDMLALDASSISLLLKEWYQLYDQPGMELPKPGITFRDYVLAERNSRDTPAYQNAMQYWMNRVDSIPGAPALPVKADLSACKAPRFHRREAKLDKARWQNLKGHARSRGLTPSGLLLAAYSEILARWSSTPHFTVNVTIASRREVHPDVNQMVGPFTSVMLHEVDRRQGNNFLDFARGLQRRFSDDYDHRQMCGVAVLREWTKRRNTQLQASMPVVFSSSLFGGTEHADRVQFGPRVHALTQTSQVWLDHHVMELHGDLVFNWDTVDEIFEEGVLDAMFAAYCDLLSKMADEANAWEQDDIVALPRQMVGLRAAPASGAVVDTERRMHSGFVSHALETPEAIAVYAAERNLSYGDLLAESTAVADRLLQQGLQPGQPVGIVMRKGWEQIAAVYGVMLANGAYMPIDADLPPKRQSDLIRIGEIKHVLTQPGALRDDVRSADFQVQEVVAGMRGEFGAAHAQSLKGDLNQLAYVIFTSGTTGTPKGVMIDHRGAMNTIAHINRMFDVKAADRVLAVSSLSFDLSVYDIFGLLDAGGALVIPDARKGHDPVHWRKLIAEQGITIWNSAPQLLQMLVDSYAASEMEQLPLRSVMLSGDFIPLDLPNRIRQYSPDAKVTSLGGATEASIWSNYYRIGQVQPEWISIPYGKALPNQTIGVYDWAMRPCPDHVKGRIFLGGAGLAIGYWRDDEKTAARFITHPKTGERLYDTGDLGRYAADGNIMILGRDDGQVKIRGHRIELGEIEAVLHQREGIKQAVVLATGERSERRQLVAYVEMAASHRELFNKEAIQAHVGDRLPDYMVPRHVVMLEQMPVTSNGKIDYQKLPAVDADAAEDGRQRIMPRTDNEKLVHRLWTDAFKGMEIGVTDNFFELGGDSVTATLLLRELNTHAPFTIEMHQFFEHLTVEKLAAMYDAGMQQGANGEMTVREGDRIESTTDTAVVLADVAEHVAKLDAMDFSCRTENLPAGDGAYFVTGVTGWIGAHMVDELLTQTKGHLYCLVRGANQMHAQQRFEEKLQQFGIALPSDALERITVLCGDIAEPRFSLSADQWSQLAASVTGIFHFAASLTLTRGYQAHSKVNVAALTTLVEMATTHHLKPVTAVSPMTVSRRNIDGKMTILTQEMVHPHPDGLLTNYAQSKWAAEQVLNAAMSRGLPIRIYRTAHALPSSRTGVAKPNDTYNTVLKVGCSIGVVPDWVESRLPGLPVDKLCQLVLEDALDPREFNGVATVENRNPYNFKNLLTILLSNRAAGAELETVSLDDWKTRCVKAAQGSAKLDVEEEALIKLLFGNRSVGKAVDNIFSDHQFEVGYFERRGWGERLAEMTPPEYWERVRTRMGW